ncbi:Alpha-L-arabinofuranosidase 2 [Nymphaea thermarum]|nr:Alpha-L-arabinofuranosidase 2 [Nymphaea thermarum]
MGCNSYLHYRWVSVLCLIVVCGFMGREISATVLNQTASLLVDAREQYKRPIPKTLFGIFFEEINHAGAGGLWAELVSNREIVTLVRLHESQDVFGHLDGSLSVPTRVHHKRGKK